MQRSTAHKVWSNRTLAFEISLIMKLSWLVLLLNKTENDFSLKPLEVDKITALCWHY